MKDLKPIRGRYYIADLVAQGEHEHQDFKYAINDARKIARSISAFANNGGGRLLIGVKDNGTLAGVRNEEDIYVVEQAAEIQCVPAQNVEFTAFLAEGGHVIIRVNIPEAGVKPVMCRDDDGELKAWYRVADENIPASSLMIKAWKAKSRSKYAEPFGDLDKNVLASIDSRIGASIAEISRKLHISQHAAEQSITKLYGMSLIDFAYIKGEFRIITTEQV